MLYKEPSVKVIAYTLMHDELKTALLDADLLPVMAARVSHNQDDKTGVDVEKDKKLMQYLTDHKHMSPFEHASVTFLVECPFYVAREWHRHRTQSFNEVSARYTSDFIGEFAIVDMFRQQATRNKQSSEGFIANQEAAHLELRVLYEHSMDAYDKLIELGVAREQARMVLPMGHLTRFYATANLRNWAHFCALRQAPDAQQEIRELANRVSEEISKIYPVTWECLNGRKATS
jgi:thymidylate synthase (FAD)